MLKKSELYTALAVTAEVTGATLTEAAIRLMAERLAPYPAGVVAQALERCQVELRGPLTLGAIFERLEDGHMGPEEAWALVARVEEDDTVVWTDQIARAFEGARRLLPDRVAARMAFLEVYRRELATARRQGALPEWWASLGQDASQRAGPVLDAVAQGRLAIEAAKRALPLSAWPPEWSPAQALGPGSVEPTAVHDLVETLAKGRSRGQV